MVVRRIEGRRKKLACATLGQREKGGREGSSHVADESTARGRKEDKVVNCQVEKTAENLQDMQILSY